MSARASPAASIIVRPAVDTRALCRKNRSSSATRCCMAPSIGECYFRGVAGERFAVRNSGAIGRRRGRGRPRLRIHDRRHASSCSAPTGRNFAAGMSGGVAYVLDEKGDFETRYLNKEMVALEQIAMDEAVIEHPAKSNGEAADKPLGRT